MERARRSVFVRGTRRAVRSCSDVIGCASDDQIPPLGFERQDAMGVLEQYERTAHGFARESPVCLGTEQIEVPGDARLAARNKHIAAYYAEKKAA